MKFRNRVGWLIMAVFASGVVSGEGSAREIGPHSNLCAEINSLAPGDELILGPGEYQGGCTIYSGGSPGRPVVIRAQTSALRPRIVFKGKTSNALNIRASHVVVRGLEFGPTQSNVDGIRIYGGQDITVEDCSFSGVGGIAVVANHRSVHDLTVRRNIILNSNATAMYFGCHNGRSCTVSGLLLERNYIHGVEAPERAVGYGIQVKLNSSSIVRDNIIADTKGPGIMIYGADNGATLNVIERNFTAGSRTSSGIVIGGGPALVRNNVAASNADAGISLEDYGHRGLLKGIAVVHNTVYDNAKGGISAPKEGVSDARIVNNAIHARAGTRAMPQEQAGVRLSGNVECSGRECFADPAGRNFSPAPGSPLFSRHETAREAELPIDDFFGNVRHALPTTGAIERSDGPIELGIKH